LAVILKSKKEKRVPLWLEIIIYKWVGEMYGLAILQVNPIPE
jgi:hypothetical protein